MWKSEVSGTFLRAILIGLAMSVLGACSGSSQEAQDAGDGGGDDAGEGGGAIDQPLSPLDVQLRGLIADRGLTGDPASGRNLPAITDPLPQLGMKLFFSKSLGGGFDSACVTCHHPVLGGADELSLSVGVAAVEPDVLGSGRAHITGMPPVPRNAPTVFNTGLWDTSMFLDSRVESLAGAPGQNGAGSQIRTPDTDFGIADINAGPNLPAAQARFPVTSVEEMRTEAFENGSSGDAVRAHLAARIGNYGVGTGELVINNWLSEFQTAFVSAQPATELVTYENIASALGEYERSMVFVNNPWNDYVQGDLAAISDQAKRGAVLFLSPANQGGAQCFACHAGDFFSDQRHHVIATPQIGPGKGDGANGTHDFGRERETGNANDRFTFRTPSLLNVEVTGPYMHAGAYGSLEQVIRHYDGPRGAVNNYFNGDAWCGLQQFADIFNCESLYLDAENNTRAALDQLQLQQNAGVSELRNINLNNNEVADIAAFLRALTDPCVQDRNCLAPWIPETSDDGPDGQQLNARGFGGELL